MDKSKENFGTTKRAIESIKAAIEIIHDCGGDPIDVTLKVDQNELELISSHYGEPINGRAMGLSKGEFVVIQVSVGSSIQCCEKVGAELLEESVKSENPVK